MLTYADVRYGEHDSTTAATEMLPDAAAAAAGAAEAVMLVNEFLVARIAQSNASSYARNTLTLTLATRAPLLSGTWVTIAGLSAARLPRASSDATAVGLTEAGASVRLTEYTEAGVAREVASELSRSQSHCASAHLLYSSSSILFEPATALFECA